MNPDPLGISLSRGLPLPQFPAIGWLTRSHQRIKNTHTKKPKNQKKKFKNCLVYKTRSWLEFTVGPLAQPASPRTSSSTTGSPTGTPILPHPPHATHPIGTQSGAP